jgi:Tol biopolymer transport system component
VPVELQTVYAETLNGAVTFWAASPADPEQRRALTTVESARFGIRATLAHDGSRIAYTFTNVNDQFAGELWVVGIEGLDRRQLASGMDVGRSVNYPIWSPDSRFLAFARQSSREAPYEQTIAIVDVQTGVETALVEQTISRTEDESRLAVALLDWSSDGRYVYYQVGTMRDVELWRVDVSNRSRERIRAIEGGDFPRCYFLSPDAQRLLCTILTSRQPVQYAVILVPTGPDQVETLISGDPNESYNPIWGPGGQEVTIAVPAQEPSVDAPAELRAIHIQTHDSRTITITQGDLFIPNRWSPDGQWLAAYPRSQTGQSLLFISQDGAQIKRIQSSGGLQFVGWLTSD